jgi:hypothetical protein
MAGTDRTLRVDLHSDRKGAAWDLLLYVPTVVALASIAAKCWYGDDRTLAYILSFLASFFFLAGANRVLKTRLMLLPSAPIGVDVDAETIALRKRDGSTLDLVKDQRLFTDYSGRSFGISGLDRAGQRLQFVLHRGQFADAASYASLQDAIRRLDKRATAAARK